MGRADDLLRVDFDGKPVDEPDDVIEAGLDDPRHRTRVPALIELMDDAAASQEDRYSACVALTNWAEPAGYQAVIDAAAHPKSTPWYDIAIDRKFSVDNTFAGLTVAIDASKNLADAKGTAGQRTEALRALVQIADTEYFDEQLEWALDRDVLIAVDKDIIDVVHRGVRALAADQPLRFDLSTQLIDLAAALVTVDEQAAVNLGMDVLATSSSGRLLKHATYIVHRGKGEASRAFGEYLAAIGGERVQQEVSEALASR
jgi:hypothetical protein